MAEQLKTALTILRRNQVEVRTGLPRSSLYDRIKRGDFPAPIPLGARSVGWLEHEVDAWLAVSGNRAAFLPTSSAGGDRI